MIEEARAAGAAITREPGETFWGGYSGVFADPDGHPWEVAHNPRWTIERGRERHGSEPAQVLRALASTVRHQGPGEQRLDGGPVERLLPPGVERLLRVGEEGAQRRARPAAGDRRCRSG